MDCVRGLLLLSGCSSNNNSSGGQDAANQRAFVRQLVGYCADVDRQLTTVNPNSQPGQVADQLDRFASQARSHKPPSAQRQQLDILLTEIDNAVRQYRSAQAALSSGNGDAYHAALNQANQTMQNASAAAQRYGMPPLADCAKKQGGPQPSTPAQPAGGWQLGSDSLYSVQEVDAAVLDGRIWVAGGLTGTETATTKTEFYDPTVQTWSPGPDLPFPLEHAMMVSYRNTVWVIGGFEPQGSEVSGIASAQVLHLNQAQDGWIEAPNSTMRVPLARRRWWGTTLSLSAGGPPALPATEVAPTEVFDGTSWHDSADIPIPGITWRPRRTGRTCTPSAGAG